jgi:hypothetical protein
VKKLMMLVLCIAVFASLAMAQPAWVAGSQGIGVAVDKLGAHQNGGRGCVGCHAPHSGSRGNGGNAATGAGAINDPNTGNVALWGQDLTPLYGKTLAFGDDGGFAITLPTDMTSNEAVTTGVMMCLSCHDGQIAKGAMMTNQSWEKQMGLLPAGYGPNPIPTLLGSDGTADGNYKNDHPIGPAATLGALGLTTATATSPAKVIMSTCGSATAPVNCILPNEANTQYAAFRDHYGTFNVTYTRTNPLVLPDATAANAYVVCTTCHTPHSMYTFSITQPATGNLTYTKAPSGTYPTYFFVWAPYNPGANPNYNQASSATQFCRQCHFTGAGGANEGSGIMNVTTKF